MYRVRFVACCAFALALLESAVTDCAPQTLPIQNELQGKRHTGEPSPLKRNQKLTEIKLSDPAAPHTNPNTGKHKSLVLNFDRDSGLPLDDADTGLKGQPWPEQHEWTQPFVIVRGQRSSLNDFLKNGHPQRLRCGLEAEGKQLILDLEKNENLLPSAPFVFYYLPDGTLVTEDSQQATHCYYHGTVQGFSESRVAVSTCDGMRGVVVLSANQSYVVEPMEDKEGEGTHIIYRTQEEVSFSGACAVTHPPSTVPPNPAPEQKTHRWKRDILTEVKYIELVLVVDNKEFKSYQMNRKTITSRMLDLANQVDWFYRPLNVRVALVGIEIWSDRDHILIDSNPTDTLNRFLDWRSRELLPHIHHDNAQLIMGGSFDGTTVGMASQSSMCSVDRSGGINVDHLVSILGVASTVAHELGHNLGMSHDTVDRHCQCRKEKRLGGCIMEPSTGFMPGQLFSSCSAQDLSVSLLQGGGMCLFNVPKPDRLLGEPRCGNLYVEKGEQCDCGLADECKDPCCNATTCKLVPGAQCSSDGICCENCKLRPTGAVCRDPLGECDLPEYCNGHSPFCPPNVFIQNGHSCRQGAAYCYRGVCMSYDVQCQVLWGANSTQAPAVCFTTVNKQGNKYGNCGQLPNGTYIPCTKEDAHCGKIQCQGGRDRPLLGSNAEILATTVTYNRSKFTCRGTYFNLGDDVTDPAMVMPGTACGVGKACMGGRCQDVSVFGVSECLKKCSGNGVCNSNKNCHCDAGWAPPDCGATGTGGSVDSGPAQESSDFNPVRVALLVIFLFVLPVALLCLGLLFHRLKGFPSCLGSNAFNKWSTRQRSSAASKMRVQFVGVATEDVAEENGRRTPNAELSSSHNGEQVQPLRYQWMQNADIPLAPPANKVLGRPPAPSKPLPPDPVLNHIKHTASDRPAPPSKPLPPDPVPRGSQPSAPAKPPPPRKALPSDPPVRSLSGAPLQKGANATSVPIYRPPIAFVPARRAPSPPVWSSQPPTSTAPAAPQV
ncbi:disintegrin and metalloproteinase domain-containing protein 15 isoform X1 [Acipenser ruthenus]|uniref:disintegrin and metalloproteinase domain-containing protein 15 isoform X1 n=1 Tax=Acipenser ruthenus TaxID=7906 RepID=UPI0027403DA2|nr:disintegrin and metalloproteinase domain-containing protein 15 isoform X1 [Acipenser ruthenus]